MIKTTTQKIIDKINKLKEKSQKDNVLGWLNEGFPVPQFGFYQVVTHKPSSKMYKVVSIHVPENNQWFYNLKGEKQELFRIPEDELIEV